MKKISEIYKDVGEEKGVRAILSAFYKKMAQDTMVGYFFTGKDLSHIIDQQAAFLLRAMGVKNEYFGKSPAAAHRKLPPILKGHFDRRLVLLRETLLEFNISREAADAWIFFEEQFRSRIVEEEGARNGQ